LNIVINFAQIVFMLLVGMAMQQAFFAACFARRLVRSTRKTPHDRSWPKATVFLALRGADPALGQTLRSLMKQDYPNYRISITIDSEQDPAWAVAHDAVREANAEHVTIRPLVRRISTCGLQCSSFVQASEHLDDETEVVVTVDGDVITHPTWLRELVAPLEDATVGATFGNRWYMPECSSWGSLVRYFWNVGAVVPMDVLGIPWGGTLAIRRDVLDNVRLPETWSRAIVPDAPTKSLLDERKLKIQFVPSLMMPNRESCDLFYCYHFLKRQLTWTRLYNSNWWAVLLHAIFITWLMFSASAIVVCGLATNQTEAATWAGVGLISYTLGMFVLTFVLEIAVRKTLRHRGLPTKWISLQTALKLPFVFPLTQATYCLATIHAQFCNRVKWRGATYAIQGRWNVECLEDSVEDNTGEKNFSL